jgi:hypothetical protein
MVKQRGEGHILFMPEMAFEFHVDRLSFKGFIDHADIHSKRFNFIAQIWLTPSGQAQLVLCFFSAGNDP